MASITFEPITTHAGVDTGRARLRLRAGGIDALTVAGIDFGGLPLLLDASGEDDAGGELVITIPDIGASTLYVSAQGMDGGHTADSGGLPLRIDAQGFDLPPGSSAGGLTLRLRTSGYEQPPALAYGYLVAPAASMVGYAGLQYLRVVDDIMAGTMTTGQITAALRDRVRAAAAPRASIDALVRLRDSLDVGDALAIVMRALVEEGFGVSGSAATDYVAVTRVMDGIRLAGAARSALEAANLVTAGVAFGALADMFAKEQVTESIDMGAVVDNILRAAARVVDGLLAGGEALNTMRFGAVLRETVEVGTGVVGAAEVMAQLREGVGIALHLNVEGEQATAYVLNTELGAAGATTYQNYPFNSFARIGGEHGEQYGMTPDGIRRIGGDSDAGAPINAAARFAMTNLGSGVAKRMQAAYLGYASNGDIRLKAIVVAPDGKREAWCYRMIDMPGEDVQQARIQIGQGLKSVYWGFGLESIDGSSFTLDLIDLHPLVLDQRMLGQGGGRR